MSNPLRSCGTVDLHIRFVVRLDGFVVHLMAPGVPPGTKVALRLPTAERERLLALQRDDDHELVAATLDTVAQLALTRFESKHGRLEGLERTAEGTFVIKRPK